MVKLKDRFLIFECPIFTFTITVLMQIDRYDMQEGQHQQWPIAKGTHFDCRSTTINFKALNYYQPINHGDRFGNNCLDLCFCTISLRTLYTVTSIYEINKVLINKHFFSPNPQTTFQ